MFIFMVLLVDFINSKKLTQKEMAEKVGTTLSYYSKIELGLRNPSYNFMEKFKANFGHECIYEIFLEEITHNV